MSFSTAGGGASGPEINVTPLIDVLLTLIIVFMVVVSMDKDTGERTLLPQQNKDQTAEQRESATIVIQVRWRDGKAEVKINRDDVPWQELEARLQEIYVARAQKVAFVKGDDEIEFQYVAEAIDFAHHAGVERVGLLGKDAANLE